MSDTPKPLTADELADLKNWLINDLGFYKDRQVIDGIQGMRLIATIEQQAEQIAKLRGALKEIKNLKPQKIGETGFQSGPQALLGAAYRMAREALAATEPPK